MEKLLLIIIGILLLTVAALIVRLCSMRKSAREIAEGFRDRLTADTNTLIDISSNDRYMRQLAAEINLQLRLLRKEHNRYQQGDLELKESVTNVSHDLRTPLTAICGYLDLLEGEEKSENAERYIEVIRNRTDALIQLTEELLQYSVVTASQELSYARMDLVRALEESLLSFYAVMQERDIQPEIKLPSEPVYRELDESAVSRIFSNIISNALKYSDGDFWLEMDDTGKIAFTNTAKNLNSVDVEKLFDRYYTVEAAGKSTGLGLSIAKTLVERMNGSISAEYSEQKLTVFVTL